MADTISRYNHTAQLLLAGAVDIDNLKAMLLDATASFTASNTTLDQVAGALSGGHRPKEVYGNGWDEGGELLDNAAVTTVATSGAMLDADDIDVTATGASIGPASFALIYDATNSKPLWLVVFDSARTAEDTTPFKLTLSANGLFRITNS